VSGTLRCVGGGCFEIWEEAEEAEPSDEEGECEGKMGRSTAPMTWIVSRGWYGTRTTSDLDRESERQFRAAQPRLPVSSARRTWICCCYRAALSDWRREEICCVRETSVSLSLVLFPVTNILIFEISNRITKRNRPRQRIPTHPATCAATGAPRHFLPLQTSITTTKQKGTTKRPVITLFDFFSRSTKHTTTNPLLANPLRHEPRLARNRAGLCVLFPSDLDL